MITAAEGKELYDLIREGQGELSEGYARMRALSKRVWRDAEVAELSFRLEVLCGQIETDPSPRLFQEIRELTEELSKLVE